jgi:hypothetical protein
MRSDLFYRPSILRTPLLLAAVHQLDGGALFKVFVGRVEKRELLADRLARFERPRDAETSTT